MKAHREKHIKQLFIMRLVYIYYNNKEWQISLLVTYSLDQTSDYMRHIRLYMVFLIQARQDHSMVVMDTLLIILDRCIALKHKLIVDLHLLSSPGSACWIGDNQ